MDFRDRLGLCLEAKSALAQQPNEKKLILLHTGAVLLLSLVISILDTLLESGIAGTGGLSGIEKRTVLTTVQSCLRLLPMLVLPFWQMGYTFVSLKFARRETASAEDLVVGFRRFLPVLRLQLLQAALYIAIGIVSSQVGTYLFMMTPWAAPILESFTDIMQSGNVNDSALTQVMEQATLPLTLCYLVVFLVLAFPFFYRLRLAEYALLDDPKGIARGAMHTSRQLMHKNIGALLKLDLHFWWYYVLDLLVTVVAYLDVLLPLVGIALPFGQTATYYITMVLYMLCQLGLYVWRRNSVSTAYALFYDAAKQPRTQATVQNQPWNY